MSLTVSARSVVYVRTGYLVLPRSLTRYARNVRLRRALAAFSVSCHVCTLLTRIADHAMRFAGIPLKVLQSLMGHKSVSPTVIRTKCSRPMSRLVIGFTVRKLNRRFKHFLTMKVVVGRAMMAGGCGFFVSKTRLKILFYL